MKQTLSTDTFVLGSLMLSLAAPVMAQSVTPKPPAASDVPQTSSPFLADGWISHRASAMPQNPLHYPEHIAALGQASAQGVAGRQALKTGDFVTAEADFRASMATQDLGWTEAGLAQALAGQGRVADAIQVYHDLFFEFPVRHGTGSTDPKDISAYRAKIAQSPTLYSFGSDSFAAWMNYALLLNTAGRWGEAVSIYEKALPQLGTGAGPAVNIHFDPAVPNATGLTAAAHLALGIDANDRLNDDTALDELGKALSLQPDSPLVNFWYGHGLKRLGRRGEARAYFQKAFLTGPDDVKASAKIFMDLR